jgi:hypothetical protein
LIGAGQPNLVRNGFVDESLKRRGVDILNHSGNDVALTAHGFRRPCIIACAAYPACRCDGMLASAVVSDYIDLLHFIT